MTLARAVTRYFVFVVDTIKSLHENLSPIVVFLYKTLLQIVFETVSFSTDHTFHPRAPGLHTQLSRLSMDLILKYQTIKPMLSPPKAKRASKAN